MALMEVNFFSNTLGMNCQANVIIPQKNQGIGLKSRSQEGKYPVLWLLHGASDDCTTWLRRTSLERYVSALGLAVVTPSAHLSMYTNMAFGGNYLDYIADELRTVMYGMFPLSEDREDNYIAGQSMGGYGAMKIGLSRPENYSAIGCFSSGNLIHRGKGRRPSFGRSQENRNMAVFGTADSVALQGTEHDLFALADQCLAQGKALPRIYQVCGTEDFLLESSREMNRYFAAKTEADYIYKEAPGEHSWDFWDIWIQDFLAWLTPSNSTCKG